jgi:hypothetical protein
MATNISGSEIMHVNAAANNTQLLRKIGGDAKDFS